jgi:hypothetical protein
VKGLRLATFDVQARGYPYVTLYRTMVSTNVYTANAE